LALKREKKGREELSHQTHRIKAVGKKRRKGTLYEDKRSAPGTVVLHLLRVGKTANKVAPGLKPGVGVEKKTQKK